MALDVSNFDFFLELPYKVKIETPVDAYCEDVTIMEKKEQVMAIAEKQRIYCNIGIKENGFHFTLNSGTFVNNNSPMMKNALAILQKKS